MEKQIDTHDTENHLVHDASHRLSSLSLDTGYQGRCIHIYMYTHTHSQMLERDLETKGGDKVRTLSNFVTDSCCVIPGELAVEKVYQCLKTIAA